MSEYPWRAPRIQAWRWATILLSLLGLGLTVAYACSTDRMLELPSTLCILAGSVCGWVYSEKVRRA